MKIPTLEEVEKYFENAETVECLYSGTEKKITNLFFRELLCNFFYYENKCVFDPKKGFAKILTYKEKPISITKEQIMEIYNGKPIKEVFPNEVMEALEKEAVMRYEGKKFNSLVSNIETDFKCVDMSRFLKYSIILSNGRVIYNRGKWAEVIEQDKRIEELIKEFGKKELIKMIGV
jgi:hypothetical protein